MSKKLRCLNLDYMILNKLLKNNLITCKDILLKVPHELVNILSISFLEATELINKASIASSIQPITVLDLLIRRRKKRISSGLLYLDQMLSVGLPIATLIEIAGPPGCGKTQLCLTIVSSILTTYKNKSIIYIDTEGAFDPVRLVEISSHKYPDIYCKTSQPCSQNQTDSHLYLDEQSFDKYDNEELSNMAKRAIYFCEPSCDNLLKRLDELEGLLVESNGALIVIDSIGAVIRRQFDCSNINATHHRNKVLNTIVTQLKLLAETYDIPILAVNQITSNYNINKTKFSDDSCTNIKDDDDISIALGPTWAHAVNTRIVLQFADGNFNRQIVLVKSPNSPQAKINYTIGSAGIIISNNMNTCSTIDINNYRLKMRQGIVF